MRKNTTIALIITVILTPVIVGCFSFGYFAKQKEKSLNKVEQKKEKLDDEQEILWSSDGDTSYKTELYIPEMDGKIALSIDKKWPGYFSIRNESKDIDKSKIKQVADDAKELNPDEYDVGDIIQFPDDVQTDLDKPIMFGVNSNNEKFFYMINENFFDEKLEFDIPPKTISDIRTCKIGDDNYTDIVITGTNEKDKKQVWFVHGELFSTFFSREYDVEKQESKYIDINNIYSLFVDEEISHEITRQLDNYSTIEEALANYRKYDNYRDAFVDMINFKEEDTSTDCKYDFIDFDGEGCLELLVDYGDSRFDIYTYKEGRLSITIKGSYGGAGGTKGGLYAPGHSCMYYADSDMGGAINYASYERLEGDEWVNYEEEYYNIDEEDGDIDDDGEIDEYELKLKELAGTRTYSSSNSNLSEKEIEEIFKECESYEYKFAGAQLSAKQALKELEVQD